MVNIRSSRHREIDVNGLTMRYLEWGMNACPPILLLHGFLSQSYIWNGFASSFGSDYHILALDQRGHGGSAWSSDGEYSIDDHFADIAGFIELLDLRDLILIGHSMGGRNALFYTACIPERIKKLILVDARPGNSDQSVQALRNLLDGFSFDVGDFDDLIQKAETLYPHLSLKASFNLIRSRLNQAFSRLSFHSYDPWMIIASQLADYMVDELWPFMESIPCPTLVIRGEYSTFLSQEEAESMGQLIPDAEIAVIPRASHLPMLENPAAFKSAIISFL
jgi:pimeloyl-ACP methyl ester carboxylesterase